MDRWKQLTTHVLTFGFIVLLAGCGGGGSSSMNNPVPNLTALSPGSAVVGAPAFTLTVTGSGLISSSVVNFNGNPRTTTFVSSTQLTVMVTPTDMTGVASLSVTVTNPAPGGGVSNTLSFSILAPVSIKVSPTSSSISDGATQQFTATATFKDGSTQDLTTSVTWSSSDTTRATINSSGLATALAIGRPQLTATLGSVSGSATLIVVLSGASNVPRFAYAADIVDNTISIYTVNSTTGQLRHNGYALAGGNPTSVAVDPASRFAYVSNNSPNTISAYAVDPTRGSLTEIAGSPFTTGTGTGPNVLAVDPSARRFRPRPSPCR